MSSSEKPIRQWAQWFEIPVTDIHRAQSFYEKLFEVEIQVNDFGPLKMGIFPHDDQGCALVQNESYVPGSEGPLVYLNANPDLQIIQHRIESAGGKILIKKRQISLEHGYMCLFQDSEGNRMALHSME